MKKVIIFLFLIGLQAAEPDAKIKQFNWDDVYPPKGCFVKRKWVETWVKDFFLTFRNLVSWDSVTILGVLLPVYFGTRAMDKDFQKCFYCPSHHKNTHQVPESIINIANIGVPVMIAGLSSLALFANNPELRLTSFTYTQSVVGYWIAKNIFKDSCRWEHNARPKNEHFCKCDDCKAYGGFPSGHTGEAVLAAVLFGLRHGPAWGVPLGLYATLVFGVSISANRHYLSQVIGGVALGLMFAAASYKVIKDKFPWDLGCTLYADNHNRPTVSVTYNF